METYTKNTYNTHGKLHEQKGKKKLNILIVDDDEDGAECLKNILELHNHSVQIINDSIRCIASCQNNKYDIVFMDYHMDGLDGSQLTQILKEQQLVNTIIFAYTGDNSKSVICSFKDAGMNGAIIKPINLEAFELLLSHIEEHYYFSQHQASIIAKKSNKSILIFQEFL